MMLTGVILCAFVLDLLFGDPKWIPHIVVLMGKCIDALEGVLRRRFPQTERGERRGGVLLAVILPLGTLLIGGGLCVGAYLLHPLLGAAVEIFFCWQSLAARSLERESARVYRCLMADDLASARAAVGRIVGRDTDALDESGVIRAAVETVAENFSDGVCAPLFFMFLGGAPLALTYKMINTMDSMVGYRNARYRFFGCAAARLDDAANFIPSRLAALLLILSAPLTGGSVAGAWRIWRRDRRRHASPNSAQTESVCAGALGIQLGGPASYFGETVEKPTIGDALREPRNGDILRANRMMIAASVLAVLTGTLVRITVYVSLL